MMEIKKLNSKKAFVLSTKYSKQGGFTMIELLIVIVILGILMAVGLGNFTNSQRKARDSQRKTDLVNIAKALEVYYNDKGGYPVSLGSSTGILTMNWGTAFYDPAVGTSSLYMNVLPADPSGKSYYYESDGLAFYLYAELENLNDGVLSKFGEDVMVYSGTSCLTGTCNYGISSSNVQPDDAHTLVVE